MNVYSIDKFLKELSNIPTSLQIFGSETFPSSSFFSPSSSVEKKKQEWEKIGASCPIEKIELIFRKDGQSEKSYVWNHEQKVFEEQSFQERGQVEEKIGDEKKKGEIKKWTREEICREIARKNCFSDNRSPSSISAKSVTSLVEQLVYIRVHLARHKQPLFVRKNCKQVSFIFSDSSCSLSPEFPTWIESKNQNWNVIDGFDYTQQVSSFIRF
jgi:hypothetical protein